MFAAATLLAAIRHDAADAMLRACYALSAMF